PSPAYLRRSIVDPQAEVPSGFKQIRAVTREGRRMIGMRVNEDTFSIQFRDAGGTLYSFFKEELAELATDDGRGAMPSFRERLEPTVLDDIVALVVSLEGPRYQRWWRSSYRTSLTSHDRQRWITLE